MSPAPNPTLLRRDQYTTSLAESPYDARLYLERARCYEELKYPDLAASDAYKALLLNDEVLDVSGEYHEQAVEAVVRSGIGAQAVETNGETDVHSSQQSITNGHQEKLVEEDASQEIPSWLAAVAERHSAQAYEILARALIECGDLKSAWDFADRGCKAFSCETRLQGLRAQAVDTYFELQLGKDPTWDRQSVRPRTDLPQNGLVRREIYPWNSLEPERFSPAVLSLLKAEIIKVAPKVDICAVDLPLLDLGTTNEPSLTDKQERTEPVMLRQLGLFATSDITPGEQILREPSILTANNRLHDPLCDACSAPLPAPSPSTPLPCCPSCDDTVFCSTSCLSRAQTFYHPAICGLSDYDTSTRDPSPTAATNALYSLLLARTIAMAETQNLHPLSLRETRYLWGEFNPPPTSSPSPPSSPHQNTLPFSFSTNIATPLHLLENLNIDIFAPQTLARYDTWVINTLLAKFRAVASAKLNPRTGMPEVCAVHWRWALANHSCAPNVRWEWPATLGSRPDGSTEVEDCEEREEGGGCIAFFARGGEDTVQWGPEGRGKRLGGLKRGEEVMSHYCDVDLPVEARREWAAGPLGGVCVCERCVWEADAVPSGGAAAASVNVGTTPSTGGGEIDSGST